jgi:ribosome-associated protein
MTKKKAVKKAKPASKPAKASSKKKSAPSVSAGTKKSTTTKAKAKAAAAPKKAARKAVAKTVKVAGAKTAKAKTAKAVKAPAKPKVKAKDEGQILAESVVNGMLEKKGQNIRWLDLRGIENSVCDYFIICEGNSNTQVDAIAQSVEDIVKKETGQRPYRSEGWENALWVLIDYVNVVVHVFERETRYFYNLESLWADAEEIKVEQ